MLVLGKWAVRYLFPTVLVDQMIPRLNVRRDVFCDLDARRICIDPAVGYCTGVRQSNSRVVMKGQAPGRRGLETVWLLSGQDSGHAGD